MPIEIFNTGVYLSLPPAHLFHLPPDPHPTALPPPPVTEDFTLKSPLNIDPAFYNRMLETWVPITWAISYFTVATIWNQMNRQRGWKPWGISKTRMFKDFTLVHNILLAVYSALTFAGMCRAMWVSTPGWFGDAPIVDQIDALCKMQGPRGLGDAVTYDPAGARWAVKNQAINLGLGGLAPDPTDVGRIWNEGLAFWGWLFYLSKFYEVIDTTILLLKGKRATTLQTFHHFGAMFAMWSGIRYMSAPIWMFVIINSFIHTLMYTFYGLSVLGYKVDPRIKRSLTTLQIMQFVLGIYYASAHLFIAYEIPVSTPYKAVSLLSDPHAASGAAQDLWSQAVVAGRSSGFLPAWAKRVLYRAVGAEGLAESVRDVHMYTDRQAHRGSMSPNRSNSPFESPASTNYRQSTHTEMVRCIDTEGQTFAIWLNVVYLIPLMVLFMRFFVKSYLRNSEKRRLSADAGVKSTAMHRRISESANEAMHRTSGVIESSGTDTEEAVDDAADEIEHSVESVAEKIKAEKEDPQIYKSMKKKLKMAKDSNIGDSYVDVIEKMRQGAMQASGTKDSSDAEDDEPGTNDTSTTSATEGAVKKEAGDNSNILNRKNSDPNVRDLAEESYAQAVKDGTPKSKKKNKGKKDVKPEDGSMGFGLNG